jgi:hypothetical protein
VHDARGHEVVTDVATEWQERRGVTITEAVGTDELYVEFYRCPCGFARVPRKARWAKDYTDEDAGVLTARVCPGCARVIKWAVNP